MRTKKVENVEKAKSIEFKKALDFIVQEKGIEDQKED